MNYLEIEAGVALSHNMQCHSRESGNLVLEMRCLIKEVPSFGLGRDIPVAQGPEVRYRTPSAMCEIMGQWFLMVELRSG